MSIQKVNKSAREVFIYVFFLFVLLLTAVNINTFLTPTKVGVLGVHIENTSNYDFWKGFLLKHPDYVPGWIELGRLDKVEEIDPNYF